MGRSLFFKPQFLKSLTVKGRKNIQHGRQNSTNTSPNPIHVLHPTPQKWIWWAIIPMTVVFYEIVDLKRERLSEWNDLITGDLKYRRLSLEESRSQRFSPFHLCEGKMPGNFSELQKVMNAICKYKTLWEIATFFLKVQKWVELVEER